MCKVQVVCEDLHWELPQQYPPSRHKLCVCIHEPGSWIGLRHPEGFPQCYKKDMGGLHCMNNTLFTLYYVLSDPRTHWHNASKHPQQLPQLPKLVFMQQFTAFVNEWTSGLLCKYLGHADIFDQEINFGATCVKYNKEKELTSLFYICT